MAGCGSSGTTVVAPEEVVVEEELSPEDQAKYDAEMEASMNEN
jgi:hypothetical protein